MHVCVWVARVRAANNRVFVAYASNGSLLTLNGHVNANFSLASDNAVVPALTQPRAGATRLAHLTSRAADGNGS